MPRGFQNKGRGDRRPAFAGQIHIKRRDRVEVEVVEQLGSREQNLELSSHLREQDSIPRSFRVSSSSRRRPRLFDCRVEQESMHAVARPEGSQLLKYL